MNAVSRRLLVGISGAGLATVTAGALTRAYADQSIELFGLPLQPMRVGSDRDVDAVRTAQYLLRDHAPDVVADGVFGPKTSVAVERMQAAHGLPRTAMVSSREDWLALFERRVRYGSRGDAVRAAQVQLGVAVDGSFGPTTRNAVVALQQGNLGRLFKDPSGVVGRRTWTHFFAPTD